MRLDTWRALRWFLTKTLFPMRCLKQPSASGRACSITIFWVTRFKPAEMNRAGYYPNQSRGVDGLHEWTQDDESVVNHDIVVWHTMGVTHNPRPEEWPVMSAAHAGFEIVPSGFFERNPALDVPNKP